MPYQPLAWVIVCAVLLALGRWGWRRVLRKAEAANVADWGGHWLNRLDGLNRIFCRRFHRFRPEPIPLPEHGAALVVANHISGLDPLLLAAACRRPLRFLIAREQYERYGLRWLFRAVGCIPVDRAGRPERAFRDALEALRRGEVVAIFPHGRIHLEDDLSRPLKSGVVRLAYLTESPIFPARIEGVRGKGRIVRAVVLRSHARLYSFPPLVCGKDATEACLQRLGRLLAGKEREQAVPWRP